MNDNSITSLRLLPLAIAAALPSLSQAGEGGFIEDTSATLQARNYYFSREFSDIRLLPPSYQGLNVTSSEIAGLTLQAGHLNSTSLRNEAGDDKMLAMLGHLPQRGAVSDAFNYAGGDYTFNATRSTASAWYGQLEDIYNQRFLGLKHSQPLGTWTLGANLGYYDAQEDGSRLLGDIDNQALFALLSR